MERRRGPTRAHCAANSTEPDPAHCSRKIRPVASAAARSPSPELKIGEGGPVSPGGAADARKPGPNTLAEQASPVARPILHAQLWNLCRALVIHDFAAVEYPWDQTGKALYRTTQIKEPLRIPMTKRRPTRRSKPNPESNKPSIVDTPAAPAEANTTPTEPVISLTHRYSGLKVTVEGNDRIIMEAPGIGRRRSRQDRRKLLQAMYDALGIDGDAAAELPGPPPHSRVPYDKLEDLRPGDEFMGISLQKGKEGRELVRLYQEYAESLPIRVKAGEVYVRLKSPRVLFLGDHFVQLPPSPYLWLALAELLASNGEPVVLQTLGGNVSANAKIYDAFRRKCPAIIRNATSRAKPKGLRLDLDALAKALESY